MRADPDRLRFEITARDGAARAGRLHTASGPVETPAFIPLATRGSVRGLSSADVEGLGYEMVLGNTFHLLLSPGPDRIAALGGLHGFMGWGSSIITDSGGFQVFSLAHGNVADEVKGQVPRGFVVLKAGASDDGLADALVAAVRDNIGSVASLKRVDVVAALPKTRSGKILRKTMRGIADGRQEAPPSTIEDASVLDDLTPVLKS